MSVRQNHPAAIFLFNGVMIFWTRWRDRLFRSFLTSWSNWCCQTEWCKTYILFLDTALTYSAVSLYCFLETGFDRCSAKLLNFCQRFFSRFIFSKVVCFWLSTSPKTGSTTNLLVGIFMIFKTLLNTEVIAQKCSAKRSKEFRNVAEEDTHDNKRI